MLMHKKVGFSRLFVFLGIDASEEVVYTGYRQTGGSPEVMAGWRKPERGLKLRFVFVKKLKQKEPEFPVLFVCYFSVFSSSGALIEKRFSRRAQRARDFERVADVNLRHFSRAVF